MAYEINLKTGLKPFKVIFDDGEENTIYFNPTDADLPKRLFEAQKKLEESAKDLKGFELDENGLPVVDQYISTTEEVLKNVYDCVDYAFGNKISDVLFSKCSPFSIVDGEYFMMSVFGKLTPIIEHIVKEETKKANAKAEKHLRKYKRK